MVPRRRLLHGFLCLRRRWHKVQHRVQPAAPDQCSLRAIRRALAHVSPQHADILGTLRKSLDEVDKFSCIDSPSLPRRKASHVNFAGSQEVTHIPTLPAARSASWLSKPTEGFGSPNLIPRSRHFSYSCQRRSDPISSKIRLYWLSNSQR